MTGSDLALFAVVAARFLVPLLIPRYPLPGVFASILVDAADESILRALLGTGFSGYQPYDKALDVYSLTITMLAALRNWRSRPAVEIGRVLYYLRLAGVLLFELTAWRPWLLIFPNTFEYFFIFYELVRAWWSPARVTARAWLVAALALWLGLKVPQEYLLHIVQIDSTDLIRELFLARLSLGAGWEEGLAQLISALGGVVVVVIVTLLIRMLAPPRQHRVRLAADPVGGADDSASQVAAGWRVFDRHLAEKVVLVGALTVIFARILPGMAASPMVLVVGVAVIAALNSFLLIRWVRRGRTLPPALPGFLLLAASNIAFVLAADLMLRRHGFGLAAPASVFLLLLLSLVVTLYDRWHPVFDARFGGHPRAST